MKRINIAALLIALFATAATGQKQLSPVEVTINFYRALKERRYVEGFQRSVYRGAVEGLTPGELRDLEPDFARAFAAIPEKIEARGEQITADAAIVFLKFDGADELQQVSLIREGGEWLVGDRDALALVKAQGRAFFFNTRILVNEAEAYEMLLRITGAEVIYSQKNQGRNASLQELIRLGGVPKDLESGEASGYKFTLTLSGDQQSFFATAAPTVYAKTGRLSFYADINSVRAEDLKGHQATERSPIYQPK